MPGLGRSLNPALDPQAPRNRLCQPAAEAGKVLGCESESVSGLNGQRRPKLGHAHDPVSIPEDDQEASLSRQAGLVSQTADHEHFPLRINSKPRGFVHGQRIRNLGLHFDGIVVALPPQLARVPLGQR